MFAKPADYPCAISDQSDDWHAAAIRWILSHLRKGQYLTVWVSQKSVLSANAWVSDLTSSRRVKIAVGRGSGFFTANGPVVALYADADDLGKITRAQGITALCVVQWADQLSTWVKEVDGTVLHELELDEEDRRLWGLGGAVELDPELIASLESMTRLLNHNNTISAGFEKRVVVRELLTLHDAGHRLPAQEMKEWAVAHGWTGDNPKRLAEFATRINGGARPRIR